MESVKPYTYEGGEIVKDDIYTERLERDYKNLAIVNRFLFVVAVVAFFLAWLGFKASIDFYKSEKHVIEERDLLKSILEEKVK